MANDIYAALAEGAKNREALTASYCCGLWAAAEAENSLGMAMYVSDAESLRIAEYNCFYNRGTDNCIPSGGYYTARLDFTGKTVGVVGHMEGIRTHHGKEAKKIWFFELNPKAEDDLPAEMEDELLPQCDIAVITGSSLVNGTLPHLLDLCRNAYTIVTGPSVPQCPALFDFGIDRLAGIVVTDIPGMRAFIKSSTHGNPFGFGAQFVLKK